MAANPTSKNAPKRPQPVTLDELVERVFDAPGEEKPLGQARGGGLVARLRGVLPGRRAAEDQTSPEPQVEEASDPARSAWGLAPTPEVQRLMGLPSASGWVPSLKLAPVFAAANPDATLCVLRGAREEQASGLRAAAESWSVADHMRAIGLRAWVLHDLVRTFPGEQEHLLKVAEATPLEMHRVLEQVPQRILAARKNSARVFEGPLARRVDAALALLASPTIRGAVPEAPALRPRAIRLAKVSTELAAVASRVEILHRRRERLQTLTRLGARIGARPEMSRLLRWEEERLRGAIGELDLKAGTLSYPEPGARTDPAEATPATTGDPVVDGVYDLKGKGHQVADVGYDLKAEGIQVVDGQLDPLAPGLIDRLQDLNLRVLTDLASLTDRVERGLKLMPVGRAEAA